MDCKKTGSLIRALRKEKGYTQKALADQIGVSIQAVSKWERGLGCPDVSLLPDLSRELGVMAEDLLRGELSAREPVGGNMKKVGLIFCMLALIVIIGQGLYLNQVLLFPMVMITKEADRFAEESTVPDRKLKDIIRNKDEIGRLAQTLDQHR